MLDLLVYSADLRFRQVFAGVFYPYVWLERSCNKSTHPPSLTMTQSEANEWVLLQSDWCEWLRTGWTTARREALFLSHASIDWTVVFCFCVDGWMNLHLYVNIEKDRIGLDKSESQEFTVYTFGRQRHVIYIRLSRDRYNLQGQGHVTGVVAELALLLVVRSLFWIWRVITSLFNCSEVHTSVNASWFILLRCLLLILSSVQLYVQISAKLGL